MGGFPQTEWLLRAQAPSGYHSEAHDLRWRFNVAKGIVFFHTKSLRNF